jgi:hypothetical protein
MVHPADLERVQARFDGAYIGKAIEELHIHGNKAPVFSDFQHVQGDNDSGKVDGIVQELILHGSEQLKYWADYIASNLEWQRLLEYELPQWLTAAYNAAKDLASANQRRVEKATLFLKTQMSKLWDFLAQLFPDMVARFRHLSEETSYLNRAYNTVVSAAKSLTSTMLNFFQSIGRGALIILKALEGVVRAACMGAIQVGTDTANFLLTIPDTVSKSLKERKRKITEWFFFIVAGMAEFEQLGKLIHVQMQDRIVKFMRQVEQGLAHITDSFNSVYGSAKEYYNSFAEYKAVKLLSTLIGLAGTIAAAVMQTLKWVMTALRFYQRGAGSFVMSLMIPVMHFFSKSLLEPLFGRMQQNATFFGNGDMQGNIDTANQLLQEMPERREELQLARDNAIDFLKEIEDFKNAQLKLTLAKKSSEMWSSTTLAAQLMTSIYYKDADDAIDSDLNVFAKKRLGMSMNEFQARSLLIHRQLQFEILYDESSKSAESTGEANELLGGLMQDYEEAYTTYYGKDAPTKASYARRQLEFSQRDLMTKKEQLESYYNSGNTIAVQLTQEQIATLKGDIALLERITVGLDFSIENLTRERDLKTWNVFLLVGMVSIITAATVYYTSGGFVEKTEGVWRTWFTAKWTSVPDISSAGSIVREFVSALKYGSKYVMENLLTILHAISLFIPAFIGLIALVSYSIAVVIVWIATADVPQFAKEFKILYSIFSLTVSAITTLDSLFQKIVPRYVGFATTIAANNQIALGGVVSMLQIGIACFSGGTAFLALFSKQIFGGLSTALSAVARGTYFLLTSSCNMFVQISQLKRQPSALEQESIDRAALENPKQLLQQRKILDANKRVRFAIEPKEHVLQLEDSKPNVQVTPVTVIRKKKSASRKLTLDEELDSFAKKFGSAH